MKSRLLVLALLLVTACSSVTSAPPAELSGTFGLALVNQLLFVTSADRSELRTLDLGIDPKDFVRAPDPLEPLSIPVLDRPVELATDRYYDDKGLPKANYVFVRGDGSSEISVVGAAPASLNELLRIFTSGTVTSIAAAGPQAGSSTLYYATWDGVQGTLWKLALPAPDQLNGFTPVETAVVTTPSEAIRALLPMPDGTSIAIATREAGGTRGRTELLNLTDLTTRTLAFPGPVRILRTNPEVPNPDDSATPLLAAGARIYGVLDEDATCDPNPTRPPALAACNGILAVDTATGNVSTDVTGNQMVPLTFGRGRIQDFTLQQNGRLVDPRAGVLQLDLEGVVTTSGDTNTYGGSIYFFQANELRQIDVNDSGPEVSSQSFVDSTGATVADPNGPTGIALADGATRDETISVAFEAALPNLNGLPSSDADGQQFLAPGAPFAQEAQVGDLIQIESGSTPCPTLLTVSSLVKDAAANVIGVSTTDSLPTGCNNRTSFTVFALGSAPWVVQGSFTGYMGRTAPSSSFVFAGSYFFHPRSFSPAAAGLRFLMGPGPAAPQPGDRYLIITASNYRSLFFTLDPTIFAGWYLPAQVVYYQPDTKTDRLFIAYPSAQGVLEANPAGITPLGANASNLVGYR